MIEGISIVLIIFVIEVIAVILCVICHKILERKGYPNERNYGSIWGFFLGIIGLAVCLFSHTNIKSDNENTVIQTDTNKMVKQEDQLENVEELMKYKQLLDTGGITQDDFDKKKKELI